MDEINPNDIEIRRVSDNKLFTVEKVTMTSDQLTATMTLTGTAAAAANTEYLQSNIPYNMIVKSGNEILSKEFIIPNVLDNAIVTAVDADNEKLALDGAEYELGDGVTVDNYFELLGKTVTAEIDETGKITSYNVANLKTVIGAFTYTAGTATAIATYKEAVSGTVYKTTALNPANASTKATVTVRYNNKFAAGDIDIDGNPGTTVPSSDLAWGKIVLNPDGTIRTIQGVATLPNTAYVTANDEGVIKNGASVKVNLKDFVIISGDQSIDKEDVAEGDVLIYNSAAQIGYVYNNPIEGTFTKNYGTKYVFAGKEYSQNVTDLKNAKEANLSSDDVDDYIKAKTDLELYTDIAGNGVYVIGESAASTSTVKLFVTSSGTSGTGDVAEASVTGFNPATEEMETYSWTGENMIAFATVRGWDVADHTAQVPVLVKLTVNAEDGSTVKKVEVVDVAYNAIGAASFLDGTSSADAGTRDKITKSTKLIGSLATDGMDTSKAKVVIYKNPAKATTAWKATNFTVADFSDWTGYVQDDNAATGYFPGTYVYGTLSKALDFLFVNSTAQATAGSTGIEAGTPFVGFVTESLDGSSKRVKAITAEGEQTYETFFEDNKAAALAAAGEGTFVVITPSKTFDDDSTIYNIQTLAGAATYADTGTADYAAYASNGATLTTALANGAGAGYNEYDVASDALVIKKTVQNGTTSYALSTATAISKFSPVGVFTPAGNNTIAKLVIFADPDTGLTAGEAGTVTAALADDGAAITVANAAREAEKAAINAMKYTVGRAADNKVTITVTGDATLKGATVLAAADATKVTVADATDPKTLAWKADGAWGITLTTTGTYYTRVLTYTYTAATDDEHSSLSTVTTDDTTMN